MALMVLLCVEACMDLKARIAAIPMPQGSLYVPRTSSMVVFLNDVKANALMAVAYGSFGALICSGICIFILDKMFLLMNMTASDPMYSAMNAIPGGVVTIIGVIILVCFIACISVAMAIFGTAMPGSGSSMGGRY